MNKVLTSLFVLLLIACTAKQEKSRSVLFSTETEKTDTLLYYDLHEIQSSGTIIAGTLSGPDTYYEYHGKRMGAQFQIAEAFAQSIGVVLQMEISPDTTTLLERLRMGEIDFIALEMPTWQTRDGESLLKDAIAEWWEPNRIRQIKSSANNTTVTVKRRMRPAMQDISHGIISAYDDLFRRHSLTAGWDWRLLAAMCYQESGFDPQAISSVGAEGLMQLMPATAEAMGVPVDKRFDPEHNILHLSEPQYYRDPDVRHGYMRGNETEAYVRLIIERWNQYRGYARNHSAGSTPSPAKKSLQDGEYRSVVKPAEEWVPENRQN